MIRSFLLIGQSNAAGRGFLSDAAPLDNVGGRLKVLRNGRWQKMFRPVNPDRPFSGSCFAERFAKEYALANPGIDVGIIPAADGGTRMEQWMPGSLLFDHAVSEARLAMRTSFLTGVLWHQGESDSSPEDAPYYRERFETMIAALRKELALPDVPVLAGELGDYLTEAEPAGQFAAYACVNAALHAAAEEIPLLKVVSAKGLGSNPDHLHFSAEALDTFGERYYQAFREFDLTAVLSENHVCEADGVRTSLEEK